MVIPLPAWLLCVLAVLTVARIVRLIADDTITEPFREAVVRRFGPDSKITTLVTCPWCLSVYVGAVVAPVTVWWGDNRAVISGWLLAAASHLTGIGARWVES